MTEELFIMAKICNINFGIGNDPPPLLELFRKNICFGGFIRPLLRLAGALVRNHTLLIDSRVRREASKWNESESFVFVSSRLCSFLYFCWGFYCSVLDKGSADPKVLAK